MSQQLSPWLESAYGWNFGEGGWNTGMDQNLLKFSFMFDRNVDSITASLPPAVSGQAHYNTTDNRLYFSVGTTYYSTVVPKWFTLTVRGTGATWQFDGVSLSQIDSPSEVDSRLVALELTATSLGTAAFEDTSAFATSSDLDIVEAQSQAYTDTLRQDLLTNADPLKGAALIGWKRSTLSDSISKVSEMLDAQEFSLWEFESEVISKPNPADFTTWDWAPAVQAAINAPTVGIQHIIKVPLGITIATTVTVNKGVRFVGAEPFDYVNAHFQQPTDTALTMFRIRAHFVEFDGIVIEGPGKTGTSMAIEVGDGITNWDKFAFINDSSAFNWNTGIEVKTQNWAIRQGATVSTCAVGLKLTGLPTTADRRNGYIQGANIHSCDIGISVPTQWQVLSITDNDFNSCIDGISGTVIRSVIADNNFFNCSGSEVLITGSLSNNITGNMILGATGAANTANGISVTGETTVLTGNNVRNKGGHGIYAATSSSVISQNIAVDNDFFNTTSFDGIHIAGGSNNIQGNVSRTTTGGASKQRYGINISSGTGNYVAGNTVNSNKSAQINAVAGNTLFKNPGFVTENKGSTSVLVGTTSIVINHGLAITPTLSDFSLVMGNSTNATKMWVSTITATQFTINVDVDPGTGSQTFGWRVG